MRVYVVTKITTATSPESVRLQSVLRLELTYFCVLVGKFLFMALFVGQPDGISAGRE